MSTEIDDAAVEILATLKRLPVSDRLDVLALATRAALDSGLLDEWCCSTCEGLARAAAPDISGGAS